jgi:hypothetical protein
LFFKNHAKKTPNLRSKTRSPRKYLSVRNIISPHDLPFTFLMFLSCKEATMHGKKVAVVTQEIK